MKVILIILFYWVYSVSGLSQSRDTVVTYQVAQIDNAEFVGIIGDFISKNRSCLLYKESIKVFVGYFNIIGVEEIYLTLSLHDLDYNEPLLKGQYTSSYISGECVFLSYEFIEQTGWVSILKDTLTIHFKVEENVLIDEPINDSAWVDINAEPWIAGKRYELKNDEIILVQETECNLKKNLKVIKKLKKSK